jgi:ADP-ribose pyrophosphatase YjhB (NUDIX family)
MKQFHDSEKAAQGQQVITACALIHHDFDGVRKIFLAKRADTKKFLPGVHEIPGGHIDFGENITKGLKREIAEEFEIEITVGDPFAVFDYTNQIKGSHSVEVIYFATLLGSPEDITLHPEDHSSCDWYAEDELYKIHSKVKGTDDPEFMALQKAFALLGGASPDFAETLRN